MDESCRIPSNGSQRRGRGLLVLVIWLAVAAAFVVCLYRDTTLMRWRYAWLGSDGAGGMLKQTLGGFREFGQYMVPAVVIVIVVTCDRRRRVQIVAALLLAELFAAMVYNPGKMTVARYRPFAAVDAFDDPDTPDQDDPVLILSRMRPGSTWLGWRVGNRDNHVMSFPSGHSAASFALAGVLAFFYPRLAWLFWVLAAGCASSRFLDAVHWPSDCLAGAAAGYLAAWLALRCVGARAKSRSAE